MSATEPQKFSVNGKVAVVTGAGSGIGFEFAKLLLESKCSVVIGDVHLRPESKELFDRYATGHPRAVFQQTDVTNWTELSALFHKAIDTFGTFDLVCPAAGVYDPQWSNFYYPPGPGSVSKDPVDGLGHYKTLDINLTHPIRATQLALAEFLSPSDKGPKVSLQNPKRIVNIASVVISATGLFGPLYVASKHALAGFIRSLGPLEELHGVRINAICPGLVMTPLWSDQPDKYKGIDLERDVWSTPRQVAEHMLKLAQDDEYAGGDMVEFGVSGTRKIPLLNNPGPQGPGNNMGNYDLVVKELLDQLVTPGWGKLPRPS